MSLLKGNLNSENEFTVIDSIRGVSITSPNTDPAFFALEAGDGVKNYVWFDNEDNLRRWTTRPEAATQDSGTIVSGSTNYQASPQLDNLGTTTINADLIPDGTYDLGTSTYPWAESYVTKSVFYPTDCYITGTSAVATLTGSFVVGVDDTGYDVKFFGDTASNYWLYDSSLDGVVQATTFVETTAAETGYQLTITDDSTQTAGMHRGLVVTYASSGSKSSTGYVAGINVDMTVSGDNTYQTYGATTYITHSGNPSLGLVVGLESYIENMGSGGIGALLGADFGINSTNVATGRHLGIRVKNHAGIGKGAIGIEGGWAYGLDFAPTSGSGSNITTAEIRLHDGETISNLSNGYIAFSGNLVIPDDGYIGSASTKNAMAIDDAGNVKITNAAVPDGEKAFEVAATILTGQKSSAVAAYFAAAIDGTTDGNTFGVGIWTDVGASAAPNGGIRALDVGVYSASGATWTSGSVFNAYFDMQLDGSSGASSVYQMGFNHAGQALTGWFRATNNGAVAYTTGAPGTADGYITIFIGGQEHRIHMTAV